MTKMQDRKHRIAFPILLPKDQKQFAETSVDQTTEMHVVPVGEWDHPMYGEMKITPEHITEFAENFKAKIRRDIPITAGHDNGMSGGELPAIGWFQELEDRGVKGLWAIVKWTEEGMKLLAEGAYKYFSPEFYEEYEDPQTRQRYSHVLVGGALTNKPYFKELKPVASFSEPSIIHQFNDSENMDLATILAKAKAEWTDEEKAFVKANAEQLTDEQKTEHADVLAEAKEESAESEGEGAGTGTEEGAGNGEGAEGGEGEGAGEGEGEGAGADAGAGTEAPKVEASEKKGRFMSEAEILALTEKADQGQQAFKELAKMKIEKRFSTLELSATNEAGRFLPKQKNAVVSFMEGLSDKQLDQFTEIVKNMPSAGIFTELGEDQGASASEASKKLSTMAEKLATEKKISFSEALREVLRSNPELEKQYSEEGEAKEGAE